jgi:hypothetical protein
MALLRDAAAQPGVRAFGAVADLDAQPETAFSLLCAVQKWPLWLSFLRSADLVESAAPVGLGSEIAIRSALPGEPEQVFEVDQFIANYHLSLVGLFSVRRRIDFRLERKTARCRLHARVQYPAYGGLLGTLYDHVRSGRKLASQVEESVLHFKHLAEFGSGDELLADF